MFRRGAAGEASKQVPLDIVPGFGPEDVYTTTFPRAYVIPAGGRQRSVTAAARLVDHLIANDVRVEQAKRAFSANGKHYPEGSYIVDMHQPKRGIANVMLEPGADITPRVDSMYDISGWSHALLWGATVDSVQGRDLRADSRPVDKADLDGSVARTNRPLSLRVTDGREIQAVNELLGQGVQVTWAQDGTAVIPASARRAAEGVAREYGVAFGQASSTTGSQARPGPDRRRRLGRRAVHPAGAGLPGHPGVDGRAERRFRLERDRRALRLQRPQLRPAQPRGEGRARRLPRPRAAWSPAAAPARPSTARPGCSR